MCISGTMNLKDMKVKVRHKSHVVWRPIVALCRLKDNQNLSYKMR